MAQIKLQYYISHHIFKQRQTAQNESSLTQIISDMKQVKWQEIIPYATKVYLYYSQEPLSLR